MPPHWSSRRAVYVLLVLDVGSPGSEEGLEGVGAELARCRVVRAAEAENGAEPLVVDELAHGLRLLDIFPVGGDVGLQDRRRADAQGHHAYAALGGQFVGGRLQRRHPDGRVRLLVGLGQNLTRAARSRTCPPTRSSLTSKSQGSFSATLPTSRGCRAGRCPCPSARRRRCGPCPCPRARWSNGPPWRPARRRAPDGGRAG